MPQKLGANCLIFQGTKEKWLLIKLTLAKSLDHPIYKRMLMHLPKSKTSPASTLKSLQKMRDRGVFFHLAETFQALGDSSRVQIVWALSHGEQNVGDLARQLDMSQPAVSHHLRTLRNLRLVKIRRDGRTSFYSLDDDHINHLLLEGLNHVEDLLA